MLLLFVTTAKKINPKGKREDGLSLVLDQLYLISAAISVLWLTMHLEVMVI